MGNDVDDVLALAMIHALQNEGRCELLAVTLSSPYPLAGAFVDAVNTRYGRPDVPIGVNPRSPVGLSPARDYLPLVQERTTYPHDFDANRAPAALEVLRRTLAAAPDHGVVLLQVGAFNNLRDLLQSRPDAISPLGGEELVRRKVRVLSLMAADFRAQQPKKAEFNVRLDLAAAREVTASWPTPMVWSGWEVGAAVTFPASAIERGLAPGDILREAYQRYRALPHERPCWDLTSVWCMVFPDSDLLTWSAPGRVEMNAEGFTRHVVAEGGRDRVLAITAEQAEQLRQRMAELAVRPPAPR